MRVMKPIPTVAAMLLCAIGIAVLLGEGQLHSRSALAHHGTGSGKSFTYLEAGFTQEIFGVSSHFMGGVAFAPDGDPWVNDCSLSDTHLHRYDAQGVAPEVHSTKLHPESTAVVATAGLSRCGMANHSDGFIYANTSGGVQQLNASTGVPTGLLFGSAGNEYGIASNAATGQIVYVGSSGAILTASIGGASSVFSSVTSGNLIDGIYFGPDGKLYAANVLPSLRVTVLNADGTLNRHIPMTATPDGIAFHAASGTIITNNNDGTMSKIVPGPDTVTTFASGGFRGDLSHVGSDGCMYLTQDGTRYDDETVTSEDSLVRLCPGFAAPSGIEGPPGASSCSDGQDNDGDGFIDVLDPDCRIPGVWTTLASIPATRESAAAALIGTRLYVSHGYVGGTPGSSLAYYDLPSATWGTGPGAKVPRYALSGVGVGTKMYAVGGFGVDPVCSRASGVLPTLEVYDTDVGGWECAQMMPSPRGALGAAAVGNTIYAVGGCSQTCPIALGPNEAFDTLSQTWSVRAPLGVPMGFITSTVALGGKLYVIGGYDGAAHSSMLQIYDPASDSWTAGPSMPTPRFGLVAGECGGRIYAIGGSAFPLTPQAANEAYDIASASWISAPPMPTARAVMAASDVSNGARILTVSGYDSASAVTTVEDFACAISDADGDAIPDPFELAMPCLLPSSADALGNPDGDGAPNIDEYRLGTDPCAFDQGLIAGPDTDGDGISDVGEALYPCLNPFIADGASDPDFDAVLSIDELRQGTIPCVPDTDGDGFKDRRPSSHSAPGNTSAAVDNCPTLFNPTQVNNDGNFSDNSPPYVVAVDDKTIVNSDAVGDACDTDDDNDGIPNLAETDLATLQSMCPTATGVTNPLLRDTDNDRITDGAECVMGSNPVSFASRPAIPAPADDPDTDRLSTAFETTIGTNPALSDTDGDGVPDGVEYKGHGSNPLVIDTDGDGTRDRCEVASLNADTIVNSGDQSALATEIVRNVALTGIPKLADFDLNKDTVLNSGDQTLMATGIGPGKCP